MVWYLLEFLLVAAVVLLFGAKKAGVIKLQMPVSVRFSKPVTYVGVQSKKSIWPSGQFFVGGNRISYTSNNTGIRITQTLIDDSSSNAKLKDNVYSYFPAGSAGKIPIKFTNINTGA